MYKKVGLISYCIEEIFTKGKCRYLQVYGVYKMNMAKFLLRGKNLNFYLYNFELQFKSMKSKKKKNVYLFKCKLYS